MPRRVRCFAMSASLILTFAACTGGGVTPRQSEDAAMPLGGTLRVAMSRDVTIGSDFEAPKWEHHWINSGFDPQKMYDTLAWEFFRCCLLRTLLSYNGRRTDEGGSVLRPDLATAMPDVSDDDLTWTFHIKAGIHYAPPFQDTEIIAADFARAMERELTPGMSPYSGDVGAYSQYYLGVIEGSREFADGNADSISGIATPDDHTLVVTLTRPVGDFGFAMSMPAAAPIPEGAADGHRDGYGRFLVSSGPYMFAGSTDLDFSSPPQDQRPVSGFAPAQIDQTTGAITEQGSFTLVRNPSWDRSTDSLRGAYVDEIVGVIGVSPEDAAKDIEKGELDVILDASAPSAMVRRFLDDPALQDRVHEGTTNAVSYITINVALPPFDNVHVRRALNYAIDKQAILAQYHASSPAGAIATHIAPDGTETGLLAAFDPYPFDPAKAREEMALSPYDRDHNGLCDAALCSKVNAVSAAGDFPSSAVPIVERDLAGIGIKTTVREMDPETFYSLLVQPKKMVALGLGAGWGADFLSASQFGDLLFGQDAVLPCCNYSLVGVTTRQLRRWGYQGSGVPSVDAWIDHCTPLVGQSALECWAGLDQLLMNDVVPWVPYLFSEYVAVVSARVTRYSFAQWPGGAALDRIAVSPESS